MKILLATIMALFHTNAHAYFDPGTGSFILQILAIVLASVATFFRLFIEKIKIINKKLKTFFSKLFKKVN